jgi:Putative Flp pilus-assembly TadE/G-like
MGPAPRKRSSRSDWRVIARDDSSGSVTVLAVVFFVMLMAVGGLAIDMQRLYGVHAQMQSYVDTVALASAVELNGQPDAVTRSFRAAVGDGAGPLVSGPVKSAPFATDTTLTVERVTFLSVLGLDPGPLASTPAAGDVVLCTWVSGGPPPGCNANQAAAAKFVEVMASPRTVSYIVLPVARVFGLTGIANAATIQLRATAGYRRQVCNSVPLMVCNPNEATQGAGAAFTPVPGQQIRATIKTGGLGPGDFSVVNAINGNGADDVRDAFARVDPNTFCYEDITIKGGVNNGPVRQGIDVRMDWYLGNLGGVGGGFTANPQYVPAPVVTKGLRPGNGNNVCNPTLSAQTMPFPRDNCFMLAPTPNAGQGCTSYSGTVRFGDGNWARNAYWSQNHPMEAQPPGYATMTRYQVYRYEIERPAPVNLDERSAPACYNNVASPPSVDPNRDRRSMIAAVVNCVQNAANLNGNVPVPVQAFARVFLTEPAGNTDWNGNGNQPISRGGITWNQTSVDDIYLEMVGLAPPNTSVFHVFPVLYR